MTDKYILTLSCADQPGLVASVSGVLFNCHGNILNAQQFNDSSNETFFIRILFDLSSDVDLLAAAIADLAARHGMLWDLSPAGRRQKVLILVSKFDHCLVDLIYRTRIGELPMEIVGIVSNHPKTSDQEPMIGDIPYHYLPVTKETRLTQEGEIKKIIKSSGADLNILARYMQILSEDFAAYLSGRCINIHHSFLPGFKGAKPYHQAFERGVKMIGATAHYVTDKLDEGPIIAQDVEAINHADRPEKLVQKGRDIESRVLARAVLYHLEQRVFINGNKTVVFAD